MRKQKKSERAPESMPDSAESAATVEPRLPIVGIGASAGGLEAFEAFFSAMPADSGIAFVLVSHLDPNHTSIMPELIQKRTKMQVLQIKEGMRVEQDTVYVVPPNRDLVIHDGILQITQSHSPRSVNLPIDNFLRSLAQDQGANAVAIILSGTGSDGTLGIKAIKGEAGMVMVQDEQTAKFNGMPRSAITTGLADYILPPSEMPEQLIKYLGHALSSPVVARRVPASDEGVNEALRNICLLLRTRTGHDFSLYKKNTMLRRIERRLHLHQIDTIKEYALYLRQDEREVAVLFKELLIGVTNFFRDAKAFEVLQKKILPELIRDKPDGYTLRVWVAGCSSGEEAYSIAILLQELMEEFKRTINVQIFGTDIDEDAVNVARAGIFAAGIAGDVSEARLSRWFIKENNQYRVKKSIREMLVFAVQSIIKDPPFTKLDLLCCRNLIIYFNAELQKRLMPVFHYSLKPDGVLFLGPSENLGEAGDLFTALDKKWKIYRRNVDQTTIREHLKFSPPFPVAMSKGVVQPEVIKKAETLSAFQLVETVLKQLDSPPCVMIDESNDIIYLHGRTGRYLEPVIGIINVNILEMARPGLKLELAAAIREVAASRRECIRHGVVVENDGEHISMDLIVKPVFEPTTLRGLMMVIFKEIVPTASEQPGTLQKEGPAKNAEIEVLEQELRHTRETLQITIEELETSNEELKSTNEELQSANEELQSANEELETSREELQSLNEEALTVNAELQNRIDELSTTNDDMRNLLDSTQIATIFLDLKLCVRRFTPKAVEIIPLADIDSGRPIKHFATALIDTDLTADAREVLEHLVMKEKEVQSKIGSIYRMRLRPYRTVNNVIDGVVITLEDITELKRTEERLYTLNQELKERKQS